MLPLLLLLATTPDVVVERVAAPPAIVLAQKEKRAKKKQKPRILVLDLGGGALAREEAHVLREALAVEIAKRAKAEVLSSEDVRRVVDVAAEQQSLDCDTEACLAELGAAMGASRVLHGSVVRLGARYVLNLSLIDPDNARALGRADANEASVEDLLEVVPDAIGEVLGVEVASEDDGFPVVTTLGVTTGVLGLVATGAGAGVYGYLFSTTQDPAGDAQLKQAYLDYGDQLGIATAVAGGVAVVGVSVFVIGLIVE